jgi:hypothetical protein
MTHGGRRSGSGRKKGAENKITTDVKEMVIRAFDQVGGADWLVSQAENNPTAFMTLIGKIIPTQVNASVEAKINAIEVVRKE